MGKPKSNFEETASNSLDFNHAPFTLLLLNCIVGFSKRLAMDLWFLGRQNSKVQNSKL